VPGITAETDLQLSRKSLANFDNLPLWITLPHSIGVAHQGNPIDEALNWKVDSNPSRLKVRLILTTASPTAFYVAVGQMDA